MISRRSLLVHGLRVSAALPFVPLHALTPRQEPGSRIPRTLVVLQLTGGNDGLNTLVPWRQDGYRKPRPTIAFQAEELHAIDDDFGLHPNLENLAELFREGQACAVHSVGVPNPNRSHFRSMEVWHTGRLQTPARPPGWIGAMADQLSGGLPALHVGGEALPLSLWSGRAPAPSIESREAYALSDLSPERSAVRRAIHSQQGGHATLDYLRQAARSGVQAAERIAELGSRKTDLIYPETPLAQKLRLVARLIEGRLGARLFGVELGGFDTHVRQERAHGSLLAQVDGALGAFQRDLHSIGLDRDVCTVVFSEFGRRVRENGSRGTDHGAASPVFFLGGSLRPGLHGTAPNLEQLIDGDVPYSCDLRGLQARIAREWMGLGPEPEFRSPPLFAL